MPEHEDNFSSLPDILRESNRPIIIYQGAPQGALDPVTSNALGLLSWLSLLTVCLIAIGLCFWSIWKPGYDASRYSPIHVEGQPRGLANRVNERRDINAQTAGLLQYVNRLQADNADLRTTNETHALINGAGGIDALRSEWDAACRSVRARLYDRRIGALDAQMLRASRQMRQTHDASQRAQLQTNIAALTQQRRDELERRRTDSDPALRCTPAAEAPVCSRESQEPWCNPERARPDEFAERRSS